MNANIGEKVNFNYCHHQRNKDGVLYRFDGCNNCSYSYKCKENLKKENKKTDYRFIELIPDYELLKEQARVNLQSPKGIEIRINISIQVEGTFGQLKQNMQYVRIRRRGIDRVSYEIMLMCLGRNIRKLFSLLDAKNMKSIYLEKNSNLKKEKFPFSKQKKN